MAQQPELLLLDDYSIGLDAGYRRLFLDDMKEYLKDGKRTVFLTSHVIQDMVGFVDEVIFLERGGKLFQTSLQQFEDSFCCYRLKGHYDHNTVQCIEAINPVIKNIEAHADFIDLFSFRSLDTVADALKDIDMSLGNIEKIPMTLEDAFIGYTGRY